MFFRVFMSRLTTIAGLCLFRVLDTNRNTLRNIYEQSYANVQHVYQVVFYRFGKKTCFKQFFFLFCYKLFSVDVFTQPS